MKQLGFQQADFNEILYLNIFFKSVEKIAFIKSGREYRVLYMKTSDIFDYNSLNSYLNEKRFRQTF